MLHTKEHYDLMAFFEKVFSHLRLDRESRELWTNSVIYQDGTTNKLFLAFRHGYTYGKAHNQE